PHIALERDSKRTYRLKQADGIGRRRREGRVLGWGPNGLTRRSWNQSGEESELRSDWQAEACPTKAVRAALGWTRQSLIPQYWGRYPHKAKSGMGKTNLLIFPTVYPQAPILRVNWYCRPVCRDIYWLRVALSTNSWWVYLDRRQTAWR